MLPNIRDRSCYLPRTCYDIHIPNTWKDYGKTFLITLKPSQTPLQALKNKQTARKRTSNREPTLVPRATIDDLPVEVLTLIFQSIHSYSMRILPNTPERRAFPGSVYRSKPSYLSSLSSERGTVYYTKREPLADDDSDEVPEVASFLFMLPRIACVCKQWRSIVHDLPEYWSRLVVRIGHEPTSLQELEAQINMTKDLNLDILVTSTKNEGHIESDSDSEEEMEDADDDAEIRRENRQSQRVMARLAPLIPRCRSFIFQAEHSSSLPRLSRDFRGNAPHLRVLKLQCVIDDGEPYEPIRTNDINIPPSEQFQFPVLTTIALDGPTFMDACNIPSWNGQVSKLLIDSLSISFISVPEDDYHLAGLVENLAEFKYIRHLTLDSIDVNDDLDDIDYLELKVDNLTLNNLEAEVTEALHTRILGTCFCFVRLHDCHPSWDTILVTHHLRLENSVCHYPSILKRFMGVRLDIINDNQFDDRALATIATLCEPLCRLYLINCPNITVDALKAMVQKRIERFEEAPDDVPDRPLDSQPIWKTHKDDDDVFVDFYADESHRDSCRPIHCLHVEGHLMKLSHVDQQWFDKRVKYFSWT